MEYRRVDLTDQHLLDAAARNASSDAERNFVEGMRGWAATYGDTMMLNDRQLGKLSCIADPECPTTFGPGGTLV